MLLSWKTITENVRLLATTFSAVMGAGFGLLWLASQVEPQYVALTAVGIGSPLAVLAVLELGKRAGHVATTIAEIPAIKTDLATVKTDLTTVCEAFDFHMGPNGNDTDETIGLGTRSLLLRDRELLVLMAQACPYVEPGAQAAPSHAT
jgi:hypothetical protein